MLKTLYQVSGPSGGHRETDETKHAHTFKKFEKLYSNTFLHYLLSFHLPISLCLLIFTAFLFPPLSFVFYLLFVSVLLYLCLSSFISSSFVIVTTDKCLITSIFTKFICVSPFLQGLFLCEYLSTILSYIKVTFHFQRQSMKCNQVMITT